MNCANCNKKIEVFKPERNREYLCKSCTAKISKKVETLPYVVNNMTDVIKLENLSWYEEYAKSVNNKV